MESPMTRTLWLCRCQQAHYARTGDVWWHESCRITLANAAFLATFLGEP